jgi:transcriptional regulator with GAF, ATPase, and Fis domain
MHCANDSGTGFMGSNSMPLSRSWHRLAPDIEIAARGNLPVLITGRADTAMMIARAIANAAELDPVADVIILDAVGADDKLMAVCAKRLDPEKGAVLVLREIHRFSPSQQADVLQMLEFERQLPIPRLRIVATSSVSLMDRVVAGSFGERLFYALNAVHIIV